MGLETGTYISDFVPTAPLDSDPANELDEHIRLVKSFVTATFTNYDEAVTTPSANLDTWDARITALEARTHATFTPATGFIEMSAHQNYTASGLGFQPSHIIAYCIDYWGQDAASYHTLGTVSWSPTGDTALSVNAIGPGSELSTVADLTKLFLTTVYPSQVPRSKIAISNVGADGFDLSFITFGGGAKVLYLAFP